jgi:hypothetical protein
MLERKIWFSKSKTAKMLKPTQLLFIQTLERLTKNGISSILTKLRRMRPRDSMKNSVSSSIDHSTLDQECQ